MANPTTNHGWAFPTENQNPHYTQFDAFAAAIDVSMPRVYALTTGNSAAIANTTAPTVFNKSFSLPANALNIVGLVGEFRFSGQAGTTGTPTCQLDVRIGGSAIFSRNVFMATTVVQAFSGRGAFIVRSTGTSGVIAGNGGEWGMVGAASPQLEGWNTVGLVTLNLTSIHAVDIQITWGAASASNTITLTSFSVILHPRPVGIF